MNGKLITHELMERGVTMDSYTVAWEGDLEEQEIYDVIDSGNFGGHIAYQEEPLPNYHTGIVYVYKD